jgi:hypothetical protein
MMEKKTEAKGPQEKRPDAKKTAEKKSAGR